MKTVTRAAENKASRSKVETAAFAHTMISLGVIAWLHADQLQVGRYWQAGKIAVVVLALHFAVFTITRKSVARQLYWMLK